MHQQHSNRWRCLSQLVEVSVGARIVALLQKVDVRNAPNLLERRNTWAGGVGRTSKKAGRIGRRPPSCSVYPFAPCFDGIAKERAHLAGGMSTASDTGSAKSRI